MLEYPLIVLWELGPFINNIEEGKDTMFRVVVSIIYEQVQMAPRFASLWNLMSLEEGLAKC